MIFDTEAFCFEMVTCYIAMRSKNMVKNGSKRFCLIRIIIKMRSNGTVDMLERRPLIILENRNDCQLNLSL